MTTTIELVSPLVDATIVPGVHAPRLVTVTGATIGLYSNGKFNATELLDLVGEELASRYGVDKLVRGEISPAHVMQPDEWGDVGSCDAVVLGTGDCGACSSSGILDVAQLEARGIPAVLLATDRFRIAIDATLGMFSGLQDLRWAEVPHPIGSLDHDALASRAQLAAGLVVEILTGAPTHAH